MVHTAAVNLFQEWQCVKGTNEGGGLSIPMLGDWGVMRLRTK